MLYAFATGGGLGFHNFRQPAVRLWMDGDRRIVSLVSPLTCATRAAHLRMRASAALCRVAGRSARFRVFGNESALDRTRPAAWLYRDSCAWDPALLGSV